MSPICLRTKPVIWHGHGGRTSHLQVHKYGEICRFSDGWWSWLSQNLIAKSQSPTKTVERSQTVPSSKFITMSLLLKLFAKEIIGNLFTIMFSIQEPDHVGYLYPFLWPFQTWSECTFKELNFSGLKFKLGMSFSKLAKSKYRSLWFIVLSNQVSLESVSPILYNVIWQKLP